ncbi:MAG: zinc ABC transporter substrate-binding protein [Chloroflexota bacterium]|nr:zinc ABC transporter substrate-binding protein [Chloroflexota bacterium]
MKKKELIRQISPLFSLVVTVTLVFSGLSCNNDTSPADAEVVEVMVTLQPLAGFVEQVGGDRIIVNTMVPPGTSPHAYAPTPSQLTKVSDADMYVEVGSGISFEINHLDTIKEANEEILIIDSSEGIELIEMAEHHHEDDDGDHERDHDHGTKDPHIWLSPMNAKTIVSNICNGLVEVDPDNEGFYKQNRDDYLQQLDKLDADISSGLSAITNRHFIVFHPAWGYFAHEYDLEQIPIEVEGKDPSARDLAHVIEEAQEHDIKIIFVSPQFNARSAEVIAADIDGSVVTIDPLAKDYIDNLHNVLEEMVQAME